MQDGWVAEFAIPFKSLSYEASETTWGFDVARRILHKNERVHWSNFNPAVNFTDRAVVDQVGQKTCVPLRCFEDVLLVAEGSKEEVDAQQIKYYARGMGKIRVGWRGKGEKLQEVLELAEVSQLGPDALAKARVAALQLEKNAYKVSKEVYGRTSPSEYVPAAKGQ